MTVNTTKITSGPYAGNDIVDTFSYTFKVADKTQLSVYETDDNDVQTLLVVDTDYTVAGVGNDGGGIITRVAGALPTNYEWFIRSNYEETQLTAFNSQGAFFPDLHEEAMDKLTFLLQQLLDKGDRSFRLSDTVDIDGLFTLTQNAANRAGLALGFDALGNLTLKTAFDPGLIDQSTLDTRYTVVFATVAAMKAVTPLDISGNQVNLAAGMIVETQGYYTAGDSGGAKYLIVAPKSADGYGDHTLSNTNVATLQDSKSTSNFGCLGSGDKRANWNAFIQAGGGDANSSFNIETFPTVLDDATSTAALATNSFKLNYISGVITGVSSQVSNSLIGVDATTGVVDVDIQELVFAGATRFRVYNSTADAQLTTEKLIGIKTSAQSIFTSAKIDRNKSVKGNLIGVAITASTALSPQLSILNSLGTQTLVSDERIEVIDNTVFTGTEVINAAFFFGKLPADSVISNNYHYNLGQVATEGFDIDGIGARCTVTNNHAIYSGFEYKHSSGSTFNTNRDVVFSGNSSYESVGTAFTFTSSGCFDNNTAYNPGGWGFFCSNLDATDVGSNENGIITGAGNKVIYAGNPAFVGAIRIGSDALGKAVGNINFDPFDSYVDPVYEVANPGTKVPNGAENGIIEMRGDPNNIRIANGKILPCTGNQIVSRPDNNMDNVIFENLEHGDTDDSCYDLADMTRLRIINPRLPANIGDRPFRLAAVSKSSVVCEEHPNLKNASTSNSGTGFLINGLGFEAGLGATNPPTATGDIWALGVTVQNTDDGSMWMRVSHSTTPATAWKQI